MKIYVIHSFKDKTAVRERVKKLESETANSEIIMLQPGGRLWKLDARKRIKQAQLVLVFLGAETHSSKNVEWEINKAVAYEKKLVSVFLSSENALHSALEKLKGSNKKNGLYEEMGLDDLIRYINSYTSGDYSLFNSFPEGKEADDKLFEQYKLFLQTSETLVARRQSVSSFYITVNTALFTLTTAILALTDNLLWKMFCTLVFSVVGIIMCVSWIRLLRSYGNLNASKLRIISIIEKKLPASLFDAEWRALSDKLNSRPYVSFTESEVKIPELFLGVYSFILLGFTVYVVLHLFGVL